MPEMHDEVVKSQKTKEKRDEKEVEEPVTQELLEA